MDSTVVFTVDSGGTGISFPKKLLKVGVRLYWCVGILTLGLLFFIEEVTFHGGAFAPAFLGQSATAMGKCAIQNWRWGADALGY